MTTQDTKQPKGTTVIATKVYGYYVKGLTQIEIAKLLDISVRTVRRIQTAGNFRKSLILTAESERARALKAQGYTYAEIAKVLTCSKAKVSYLLSGKKPGTKSIQPLPDLSEYNKPHTPLVKWGRSLIWITNVYYYLKNKVRKHLPG